MRVEITPARGLLGEVEVPGDKSISHRGIMLGAISQGNTRLRKFLKGQDCITTADAFESMGIETRADNNDLIVCGKGLHGLIPPKKNIYAGNSGTTARLISGILAGQSFSSTLDGDESLKKRPMKRIIDPLIKMGADINAYDGNFLPLYIKSNSLSLKGIEYTLPVASAQVKSAIILAALYADDETTIHQGAISRDHTEIMLKQLGGIIKSNGMSITIEPPNQLFGQDITIPGDISSASYLLTAAILTQKSELLIKNVGINPTRTGILDIYNKMGARINLIGLNLDEGEPIADIQVKSSDLESTVIEGNIIPRLIDEIPIIALAATQANGKTIIRDARELKVKESNRIDTVVNVLKTFGADITATDDGMVINGPTPLNGAAIHSSMDHRIAMTCAVAGLIADGQTTILDGEWADISYPGFFDTIRKLKS